jgi:hypothetical protein
MANGLPAGSWNIKTWAMAVVQNSVRTGSASFVRYRHSLKTPFIFLANSETCPATPDKLCE